MALRLLHLRARFGRSTFPRGVSVGAGVSVSITDGASARFAATSVLDRNATVIVKHGRLTVGERTYVGIGSVICARDSVTIGDDVLIAEHVTIRDQDHVYGPDRLTARAGFSTAPIVIGDNVWLGAKVTVTKGVTIGANSVVGANAVVTEDIPPGSLALGVPARVIRRIG